MVNGVERKIIHCDCDCFYVSVEMRDDPALRGRPVAVGGLPERRGVISTCNYEAREYGVRSAMASALAKKLCPDLLIIPANFNKYHQVSQQIRQLLYEYTEQVEPLSLDEAFLDVTDSSHCRGSATLIAEDIRRRVEKSVGITISAGVAPNKFLAKVASDWNKPDGMKVILPADVDSFVSQLPVNRIFGVGKVTAKKLQSLGVETCSDLSRYSVFELTEKFGRFGRRLKELSLGIDHRQVETHHFRQSLSVERTYSVDLANVELCLAHIPDLFVRLKYRLGKVGDNYVINKLFVKLKFCDFKVTTLERSNQQVSLESFKRLCREAYSRGNRAVRLLGIGVRFIDLRKRELSLQLSLFDDSI